ncbi:oligopeptide/dipeptide ABC transporter ATP-binding protein [Roseomonas alkaliterrae]|uniref:Oligopeptide/dipeptide ABC transporter ATP-binding protein n=1 Tax=Neoroseomonas alkaliterrae TaxID=1452450 RepID=A0A840XV86_9PROT|nr:ABC transporter ATP-binding protein [Neoroseomonas alkaliterrae]MBB5688057.1 oligopeptide/dipeptide ABC transporter ATP-binding protein [Neoroseomonas alkaliterrae]
MRAMLGGVTATATLPRDAPAASPEAPLLSVRGLTLHIPVPPHTLRAVDGISFDLRRGETLGLVGESGSGKTLTAMAVMRLLEPPLSDLPRGKVLLEGRDLMRLSETEMSTLRGRALSMIFQEPMTSLNPVMTVGRQIAEPVVRHLGLSARQAAARAEEMLRLVGIPDPPRVARAYPHLLSGGMRQRAMIAIALACRPSLLIADEPTTALDVTVQAQILDLLAGLQREMGSAVLLITHDLAVIAETAHRVAVMYAGRIVEEAPVGSLFAAPRHPYTRGLLASIPLIARERPETLPEIPGMVPGPGDRPAGCAFAPRCGRALPRCAQDVPPFAPLAPGHHAACWNPCDG